MSDVSFLFDRFSQDELERLDSEGRVMMTDHSAFILINVYGPAISTEESAEERYAFKLRFYEVGSDLHIAYLALS